MDPNANITEQILVATKLVEDPSDVDGAQRLADLVLALDEWIVKGGFLPERWGKRNGE